MCEVVFEQVMSTRRGGGGMTMFLLIAKKKCLLSRKHSFELVSLFYHMISVLSVKESKTVKASSVRMQSNLT